MISQHWFRKWLGAVRQQAITWANVDPDLCRHTASPGHNELNTQKWEMPDYDKNDQCVLMKVWSQRAIETIRWSLKLVQQTKPTRIRWTFHLLIQNNCCQARGGPCMISSLLSFKSPPQLHNPFVPLSCSGLLVKGTLLKIRTVFSGWWAKL